MADTLKSFMKSGVAGRKSEFLRRNDIGGKTGTPMIRLAHSFQDSIKIWLQQFGWVQMILLR